MRWRVLAWIIVSATGCGDGGGGGADARVVADAASLTCDTVRQDCASAATPKCTLVQVGSAGVPRCLSLEGAVTAGLFCERSGEVGRDDCAAGLYCSGLGFPVVSGEPPDRVCRRFCRDAAGCGEGEACLKVSFETPPDGLCAPVTCSLFGPGCPAGMTCDALETTTGSWVGLCRSPGAGEPGGLCVEVDCVAGAHCERGATAGTATCRLLCDDAHPCPGGATCAPLPGLGAGGGLCRS
jgi:hypothetical protein